MILEAEKVYNPNKMSEEDWPSKETMDNALRIIQQFNDQKQKSGKSDLQFSLDGESH